MTHRNQDNGTLRVTIVEARQLKDRDLIGEDDPFVELYLDKEAKQRTATIQETNNPIWNETFTLFVRLRFSFRLLTKIFSDSSPLHKHQDHLHIHVYDDDDRHRRDSIGSAKVNLKKHVLGKGQYEDWVKLPTMMGLSSHGRVHLIIEHLVNSFCVLMIEDFTFLSLALNPTTSMHIFSL